MKSSGVGGGGTGGASRTVARKWSIGGLYVRAGGAWHSNLTNFPLIYNVSYFIWGSWSFVWRAKPTKALPWRRDWVQAHPQKFWFFIAKNLRAPTPMIKKHLRLHCPLLKGQRVKCSCHASILRRPCAHYSTLSLLVVVDYNVRLK